MTKRIRQRKTAHFKAELNQGKIRAGRENTDAVIAKITERFKDRSRKDIKKWRQAIALADYPERPRYEYYFDLVDDLATDGKFQSQVMLRKTATLAMDFQVKNKVTGEINEQVTDLLRQKWFYRLLDTIVSATIFGTRLIEFQAFHSNHLHFEIIPPRNTVPQHKRIYPDVTLEEYINYDAPEHQPWILEINGEDPKGLVNNIIPNLIWKRNVSQSWAEFCEKFGMPLVSATTNNSNTKHIDEVERQLLSLAEASVAVFPEGTTIKFEEANRTDAYQVYQKFIDMNTSEISSLIVGSNTLSDDATNRAQTEVHERSLDEKISKSDRREIAFIVNDELLPLLRIHGYGFISEADTFEFIQPKENISLVQYWNIVQGIMQQHEVDQDWLAQTFDVPITGKRANPFGYMNPGFWQEPEGRMHRLKKKRDSTPEINGNPGMRGEKKGNDPRSWKRPDYPIGRRKMTMPRAEAGFEKRLKELSGQLAEGVYNQEEANAILGQIIAEEGNQLVAQLRKGFKTFSPYTGPDQLALQMMEYNVFAFSAGKTEARLAAMQDLLIDEETKQIRSSSEFKELAQKEVKNFNGTWLETERNLSIAVGQTSAQYIRYKAEEDEVTSYVQYQTAGDDQVRESHQLLNGRVFSLKDKEAMDLWPPNGYNCRCEMVQFLGDPGKRRTTGKQGKNLMKQEDKRYENSQFEINRGHLKEVFTKEQFYHDVKDLPKRLNAMTFEKYGLKKWAELKSRLKNIKLDKSITKENAFELFKKEKGKNYMGFEDYLGRKMVLTEEAFKRHTKGKYVGSKELRHQLFPHVKNVLKNPDEVWMFEYSKNKFQTRYVKFFGDHPVMVTTLLEDGVEGLQIKTWYMLKGKEADQRKGILIKKGKDL